MKNLAPIIKNATALGDLDDCPLHRKTPFGICNVTQTQFSISRFSGMCKFNGETFIYIPVTDELIREDVLAWKMKKAKAELESEKAKQQNLI